VTCIPLAKRRSTAVRGYCGSASPLCDYLSSLLVAHHRDLVAIGRGAPAERADERITWRCTMDQKVAPWWHFRVENTLVASEYIRGDYEPSAISGYVYVTSLCQLLSRMHSTSTALGIPQSLIPLTRVQLVMK